MVNIPPRRVYYGYMETTQGIETLFRRYYPAMRRLATMLLHDEEAARDTVQDVFEKLLSRGVRPDRPEAGVYLLKAVRNACLNRIRDFDTETRLRNLYLLDSEAADADDWPDEALLALPLAAAITSFKFRSMPLPEALGRIARVFPETRINFIYNRLEDYKVNADVNARTSIEAVRQTLERLPVKGIERGGKIYVETLREGGLQVFGHRCRPFGRGRALRLGAAALAGRLHRANLRHYGRQRLFLHPLPAAVGDSQDKAWASGRATPVSTARRSGKWWSSLCQSTSNR